MIDREMLAKNYASSSDEKLLELHASETLTQLAYEIIELELKKRKLELPAPKSEVEKVRREQKAIARKLLAEQYANKTDAEIQTMLENRINLSEMALFVLLNEGKKRGMLHDDYMPQTLKLFFNFFGYDFDNSSDLNKAIIDLTNALQLDPTNAETYLNRGRVYFDLGDLEQVIQDFERYLELAPNTPQSEDVKSIIKDLKLEIEQW